MTNSIGGIILLFIIGIAFVILMRFLFLNWLMSRILCIVAAIISIIAAVPNGYELVSVFMTALSWCFFIGPVIFDVEYDGTYTGRWNSDYTELHITPNQKGGFWANSIGALIVTAFIYLGIGPSFRAIFFIVPLLLIGIDTWSLLLVYMNR